MVWIDPQKPLEAAMALLWESRKCLGRNRPVLADRNIAEAMKQLGGMMVTESSTTQTSAKSTTAEFAANCDKESE